MRSPSTAFERHWIPILAVVAVALLSTLFLLRPSSRDLRGDEGTYVAMAASLARDFDLRFAAPDRAWAEAPERGGVALILQKTGHGVVYSKPILYPLLAAPFALVAGDWGAAILNLLVLAAAFAVALRTLAPGAEGSGTRDVLLTFAATGLVLVYLPWRMTESLQIALALAGLALTFGAVRGAGVGRRGEIAGAALLGLLISLREPNALVAAAPVVAAFATRQPLRAVRLGATIAASYLAMIALTAALTGAVNPYKAARSTFNAETGYPVGEGSAEALARFESTAELATSTLGVVPVFDAAKSAYATLYFLVGRHTGVVPYLPAVVMFFLAALSCADRAGRVALGAFAAQALFYLVWMPVNYFGGETFVGNRYILAAIPLPLVALRAWPTRRALLAVWVVSALVGGSALASVVRTRALDATSQSHASAGIFRLLPYESTASNLDGRRDRYWAGDFVRFVDPYAEVGPWSFTLRAGEPSAELEIATREGAWDGGSLHFIAQADRPGVRLVISDWAEQRVLRLADHVDGSGGPLVFETSPAWRRHTFWWSSEERYAARTLRIAACSADEKPATVRLRYLGRSAPPETGFGREVVRLALRGESVAGEESQVDLELVNRSAFAWTSAATLPVQVGLKLRAIGDVAESSAAVEERRALPGVVKPGERVALTFPVRWPARPGRYEVTLDLVLEDAAWFEERIGAPIARTEVEVRAR